jgi:hypothetical protein
MGLAQQVAAAYARHRLPLFGSGITIVLLSYLLSIILGDAPLMVYGDTASIIPYQLNDAPIITNVSVAAGCIPTIGGSSIITIKGAGFGGTGVTGVVATYGINGVGYQTTCSITVDDSVAICGASIGSGKSHAWIIEIPSRGKSAPSSVTTSYCVPTLTLITSNPPSLSTTTPGALSITGTNFGATDSTVIMKYWSRTYTSLTYTAASCMITASSGHTIMVCASAFPAIGDQLSFQVTISDQLSNILVTSLSYDAPIVTSTSPLIPTTGGSLELKGKNYGSASLHPSQIVGTIGTSPLTSCQVNNDVQITCVAPEGIGGNLPITLSLIGRSATTTGATASYALPYIESVTPPSVPTTGNTPIIVQGNGFGPKPLPSGTVITLHYGPSPSYDHYTATNCELTTAHTTLTCRASAGVGVSHRLVVSVAGQASLPSSSTASLSYSPAPSITNISSILYQTPGSDRVTITGNAFGPIDVTNVPVVTFGPSNEPTKFQCSSASIVTADTQLTCTIPPGYGRGHQWRVSVGGQQSTSSTIITGYAAPSIGALAGATLQPTTGGFIVTIVGFNFGVLDSGAIISAKYGPRPYTATGCRVTVDHTHLECAMVEGSGHGHHWSVTVDTQTSELSVGVTSYNPPTITSITGGPFKVTGGDIVTLHGDNYGPTDGSSILGNYGPYGFAGECRLTQPHHRVECTTSIGVGANLFIIITVNDQINNASVSLSYLAPVITSIDPPLINVRGGQRISIIGSSFASVATVALCDGLSYVSTTLLTCTARAHTGVAPFSTNIIVVVGGQSSSSYALYYYQLVSHVTPSFGHYAVASTIDITGDGLDHAPSSAYGTFTAINTPSIKVPLTIKSSTSLTGSVAANSFDVTEAIGMINASVSVTLNSIETESFSIPYTAYRTDVASIAPHSGPLTGATSITITGRFFPTSYVGVRFGAGVLAASATWTSPSTIVAITPSTTVATSIKVEVTVESDSSHQYWSSSPSPTDATFQTYDPPSIVTLSPSLGPVAGGTKLILSGSIPRVTMISDMRCWFGGSSLATPATYISDTSTSVTCQVPQSSVADTPVQVSLALNNQQGSNQQAFRYYYQPILSSVRPSLAVARGGATVSVIGSGFIASSFANVKLSNSQLANIPTSTATIVSPSLVTFVSPILPVSWCTNMYSGEDLLTDVVIALDGQQYTSVNTSMSLTLYCGAWPLVITPALGLMKGGNTMTIQARAPATGVLFIRFTSGTPQQCTIVSTTSGTRPTTTATCQVPPATQIGLSPISVSADVDASTRRFGDGQPVVSFYYHTTDIAMQRFTPSLCQSGSQCQTWLIIDAKQFAPVLPTSIAMLAHYTYGTDSVTTPIGRDLLIPFTLTYSTSVASHERMITVDFSSISSSAIDSSCSMIHFGIVPNGDSSQWIELPFYTETCNTAGLSRFWVRVPTIPSTTGALLSLAFAWHYKSVSDPTPLPTPPMVSNGALAFTFYDQFFTINPSPWKLDFQNPMPYEPVSRPAPYRSFIGIARGAISPRMPAPFFVNGTDTTNGFAIHGRWIFNNITSEGRCITHFMYWSLSPVAFYVDGIFDTDADHIESLQWNCDGSIWFYNGRDAPFMLMHAIVPQATPNKDFGVTQVDLVITKTANQVTVTQRIGDFDMTPLTFLSRLTGALFVYNGAYCRNCTTQMASELAWIGASILLPSVNPTPGITLKATNAANSWALLLTPNTTASISTSAISLSFNGQSQYTSTVATQIFFATPVITSLSPSFICSATKSPPVITIFGTGFPATLSVTARLFGTAGPVTSCTSGSDSVVYCPLQLPLPSFMSMLSPVQLQFDGQHWISPSLTTPISNVSLSMYTLTVTPTPPSAVGPLSGRVPFAIHFNLVTNNLNPIAELPESYDDAIVMFNNIRATITDLRIELEGGADPKYILTIVVIVPAWPIGVPAQMADIQFNIFHGQNAGVSYRYLYYSSAKWSMSPHGGPLMGARTSGDIHTIVRFSQPSLPSAAIGLAPFASVQPLYLVKGSSGSSIIDAMACWGKYNLSQLQQQPDTIKAELTQRIDLMKDYSSSTSTSIDAQWPFYNCQSTDMKAQSLITIEEMKALGLRTGDNVTEIRMQIIEPINMHLADVVLQYAYVEGDPHELESLIDWSRFTTVYSQPFAPLGRATLAEGWLPFVLNQPIVFNESRALVFAAHRRCVPLSIFPGLTASGSTGMRLTMTYRSIIKANGTVEQRVLAVPKLQMISNRAELSFTVPSTINQLSSMLMVPSLEGSNCSVPAPESPQWIDWRFCLYPNQLQLSSADPAAVDRTHAQPISFKGDFLDQASPLDVNLTKIRYLLVDGRSIQAGYYIDVHPRVVPASGDPGSKASMIASSPTNAEYGRRPLFVKMYVDVSLNGQTFTKDFRAGNVLAASLLAVDPPEIRSFWPRSMPQFGRKQIIVNATNLVSLGRTLSCMWHSNVTGQEVKSIAYVTSFAGWDMANSFCANNCTIQCLVPSFSWGNHTLSISVNSKEWFSSPQLFEFTNCDAGTTAAAPSSPCQTCLAGKFANTDHSNCLPCAMHTFASSAGNQDGCTACFNFSGTLQTGSASMMDCLCNAPTGFDNGYFKPHRNDNSSCQACLPNTNCLGGWELPRPWSGYHLADSNVTVFPCDPQEACPAPLTNDNNSLANLCADGYDHGHGCLSCDWGHYRAAGRCWSCGSQSDGLSVTMWITLGLHIGLLWFMWWNIEVFVKMGSLTIWSSFLNTVILISFIRVLWPSYVVQYIFGWIYTIGHVFFWPDFISLSAWECATGPLEMNSGKLNAQFVRWLHLWPVITPLAQFGFLIGLSILSKVISIGRSLTRWPSDSVTMTKWGVIDRAWNTILLVAMLEAPFICHSIMMRFAFVPRDDVEDTQLLRPALTYVPASSGESTMYVLSMFLLIPPLLSWVPVIPTQTSETRNKSRKCVGLFKRFDKQKWYRRRWEFILSFFGCAIVRHSLPIVSQHIRYQSLHSLCACDCEIGILNIINNNILISLNGIILCFIILNRTWCRIFGIVPI